MWHLEHTRSEGAARLTWLLRAAKGFSAAHPRMTRANVNVAKSPWVGILWCTLGLLSLVIGAVWFSMAAKQLNLWLHADRYVAAELEVTRFDPESGEGGQGRMIEGVIHPGGEPVWTSDSN